MKIIVDKSLKEKVVNRKSKLMLKKEFGQKPDKIITIPKDRKNG